MTSAARLAVLLATLVPVTSMARAQDGQPVAPLPPPQQVTDLNSTTPDAGSLPVGVDSKTYEIGSGDALRILVWRQRDFSGDQVVRPDGKITVPLIGDLQAEGLTPERLSGQLEQALASIMNDPEVTVSVLQVRSKTYTVTGLVLRPGQYPMPTPIRVFEALNLTGGFQQWANQKDIRIIRDNGSENFKFNYKDFIKGKHTEQNILLQNGDTIYVHD